MPPKSSKGKEVEAASGVKLARYIHYEELDKSDKFVFDLNSDVQELKQRFSILMEYMRRKASEEGCDFGGIYEVRCVNGCPLLEIKVTYKDISTKFLIAKTNLYIVGYSYKDKYYCFKDADIKLIGCEDLVESTKYEYSFCTGLGAKMMKNALYDMQKTEPPVRKKAAEAYFVHLSESARFRPIESQIYVGIELGSVADFDEIPDWENKSFAWFRKSKSVGNERNIMTLISPSASPNFDKDSKPFDFARDLVHNWESFSACWISYIGTESLSFDTTNMGINFQQCGLRNLHCLKSTLALLSNVNLGKLYSEVGTRSKSGELMKLKDMIGYWERERSSKELPK